MNNLHLILIIVLVIFLCCHLYQLESFPDDYKNQAHNSLEMFQNPNLNPNLNLNPNPNLENMSAEERLQYEKDELIKNITDKLVYINGKIGELETKKPVNPSIYTNLFEKELPEFLHEHRTLKKNKHLFDVYQRLQNKKIQNVNEKINNFVELSPESFIENNNEVKSVKSHVSGMNLNLLSSENDSVSIPINEGCLFTKTMEDGSLDYGVTDTKRNDKNKLCLKNHPEQLFDLNKINDLESYKAFIGNNNALINTENISFPFYMITPKGHSDKCMQVGPDGIHFENCHMKISQRWDGLPKHKECKCV